MMLNDCGLGWIQDTTTVKTPQKKYIAAKDSMSDLLKQPIEPHAADNKPKKPTHIVRPDDAMSGKKPSLDHFQKRVPKPCNLYITLRTCTPQLIFPLPFLPGLHDKTISRKKLLHTPGKEHQKEMPGMINGLVFDMLLYCRPSDPPLVLLLCTPWPRPSQRQASLGNHQGHLQQDLLQ